jgi:chromosomal replication initiator protein
MPQKKDIWNQITRSLKSKLTISEYNTWFAHTSLEKLDNDVAVISVPNKFVATWLRDKYLTEMKKIFKKILRESPQIHFQFKNQPTIQEFPKSHQTPPSDLYRNLRNSLNRSMTFNRFTTGDSNRLACSSAIEVANRPAAHYNPLYLFCNLSLGKTHLLHAIGNHVLNKDPLCRTGYLSLEILRSDFTYSRKQNTFYEFREKYHNLDLILFDDIHLLANRQRMQEEFLSIFNSLYGEKKQIVITGDRPPNRLKNINSQLQSRLGWGLLVEIQEPDQKTKIDIINNKVKEDNIDMPDDIVSFLAKSNSDMKTLMKNIIRLETYISLNNGDINITMVKSLIQDKNNKSHMEIDDIQSLTAGYFNITVSELISNKKNRVYSYPRHVAMYLSRKYTNLSFQEIGYSFGQKDHSTVIYALRRIEKLRKQGKETKDVLTKIEIFLT